MWHSESPHERFYPCLFTWKYTLQRVIGVVWDLWSHFWVFTRAPPGYPAVALCWGDFTALCLQVWSLHMIQQIINGVDEGAGLVRFLGQCPHNFHYTFFFFYHIYHQHLYINITTIATRMYLQARNTSSMCSQLHNRISMAVPLLSL